MKYIKDLNDLHIFLSLEEYGKHLNLYYKSNNIILGFDTLSYNNTSHLLLKRYEYKHDDCNKCRVNFFKNKITIKKQIHLSKIFLAVSYINDNFLENNLSSFLKNKILKKIDKNLEKIKDKYSDILFYYTCYENDNIKQLHIIENSNDLIYEFDLYYHIEKEKKVLELLNELKEIISFHYKKVKK